MSSLQAALARAYISEAIKNSSASIKACWTIVFTAATIGALTPLTKVLRCALHIPDTDDYMKKMSTEISGSCVGFHSHALWITIWLFIIYFTTFIRFYLGGLRVFDIKYSEMFSLINAEIALASNPLYRLENLHVANQRLENAHKRFVDILAYNDTTRYKFEVFWLLLQSLIVVSLAYDIALPRLFVETFAFLIACNSFYLFLSIVVSHRAITNLEHEVFPEWSARHYSAFDQITRQNLKAANLPNHAAWQWACNNAFHAILILFYLITSKDPQITLLLFYCSTNALIDFVFTRNFYFPKFLTKYNLLQPKQDGADFDI